MRHSREERAGQGNSAQAVRVAHTHTHTQHTRTRTHGCGRARQPRRSEPRLGRGANRDADKKGRCGCLAVSTVAAAILVCHRAAISRITTLPAFPNGVAANCRESEARRREDRVEEEERRGAERSAIKRCLRLN